MMIIIKESKILFKNPIVGQATRATVEHYNGRTVKYLVDGEEKLIRFKADELAFDVTEEQIETAIQNKLTSI